MTISTTNGNAPNSPESSTYSAYITEELRRYDEHLRDVRGLAAGTRKDRLRMKSAAAQHSRLTQQHVSPHTIRHTTAMHLLQAGVDISVIALWLGHESPVTTHHYVEADLTMKERALAKLHEPDAKIQRYRAPDSLLDFLKTL